MEDITQKINEEVDSLPQAVEEPMHYFSTTFFISFLFNENRERNITFPVNVVMELKDNNVFSLANIEYAKNKAIEQLSEVLNGTSYESYAKDAAIVLPIMGSVNYLGCATHTDFVGTNVEEAK